MLDPFVGGGTTMLEALELGRAAVGVDLNDRFCDHVLDTLAAEYPMPTEAAGTR